jgi:hypothetical protein
MVLTLHIGLLFWASDTTLRRSQIVLQEEFRRLISAMTVLKNLPRLKKQVRLLWERVKNNDTSVKLLCFILCCDFHSNYKCDSIRERHFLNSLSYLFIAIYEVLFHGQKLIFLVL